VAWAGPQLVNRNRRAKPDKGIETHADDKTGYLIGNYVFYDRRGVKEVTYEGRTLETYRKEPDGTWKCSVDMWHHLDPAVISKPLPR